MTLTALGTTFVGWSLTATISGALAFLFSTASSNKQHRLGQLKTELARLETALGFLKADLKADLGRLEIMEILQRMNGQQAEDKDIEAKKLETKKKELEIKIKEKESKIKEKELEMNKKEKKIAEIENPDNPEIAVIEEKIKAVNGEISSLKE
jgi:chromosome segregation ATPase